MVPSMYSDKTAAWKLSSALSSKPVDSKGSATSSQGNCTPDHNYVTVWHHTAPTEVVECTNQWHNLYFVMSVSGQFLIYSCLAKLQKIKTSNTPQITYIYIYETIMNTPMYCVWRSQKWQNILTGWNSEIMRDQFNLPETQIVHI